mgnify:CR=1 FL=1
MARKTKVREHKRIGTSGVREHARTLPDAPMGNQKGNFESKKELIPKYDNAQSFYGKAYTKREGNQINLYSYNTLVATYHPHSHNGKVYGYYSQTTLRHIREFFKQMGLKAESKSQIIRDYE